MDSPTSVACTGGAHDLCDGRAVDDMFNEPCPCYCVCHDARALRGGGRRWQRRLRRRSRRLHNDRDAACAYWTGDRSGSVIGVVNERCTICNPKESS